MKDRGATGSRKLPAQKSQSSGGRVPFGGAVILALCCSGAAYYVGDRAGYARGTNEALTSSASDPIEKMDCMAKVHRAVTAPKAEPAPVVKPLPPPPAEPVDLSFHTRLKGGAPSKPVERAIDPLVSGKTLVSAAPTSAPPPEEKPEPKPATPAGLSNTPATGEFTLQVGAFPNKADALKMQDRLKGAGFKPSIYPSELGGSTWYRVRVGRFADRPSAETASRALQSHVALSGVPVKQ